MRSFLRRFTAGSGGGGAAPAQPRDGRPLLENALAALVEDLDLSAGAAAGDDDESDGEDSCDLDAAVAAGQLASPPPPEVLDDTGEADALEVHIARLDGAILHSVRFAARRTAGALLAKLVASGDLLQKAAWPRLVFGQQVLHSEEVLREAGVKNGDTLHLVLAGAELRLDLSDNGLGAEGVEALAEALPQDAQLRSLALNRCKLEGDAAGRAVAAVARKAPGLESLQVAWNSGFGGSRLGAEPIDISAFASAAPLLPALRRLGLVDCGLRGPLGGAAAAAAARRAPFLEVLELRSNSGLGVAGIAALKAELMRSPSHLQVLDLGDCGLSRAAGGRVAASLVAVLTKLRHLSLARNTGLGSDGLVAFAKALPVAVEVVRLDIHVSDYDLFSDDAEVAAGAAVLRELGRAMPSLQDLWLGPAAGALRAAAAVVQQCPEGNAQIAATLQSLHLSFPAVVGGGGSNVAASLPSFQLFPALRHLDLSPSLGLSNEGLRSLCTGLTEGVTLETLRLAFGGLEGADAGQSLAELARRCTASLHHLDVSGNRLAAAGMSAFAAGIGPGSALLSLAASDTGLLGAEGGGAAAAVLRAAPALRELVLSHNGGLGTEGLVALAGVAPEGLALASLEVACCAIEGTLAGKALATLMGKAPALQALDLSANSGMVEAGLDAFREALNSASTGSLHVLDLGSCRLENTTAVQSAVALAQAFPDLRHLRLSGNWELQASGVRTLTEALLGALQVQVLDLGDCGLEGEAGGAVAAEVIAKYSSAQRP